LAGEVLQGIDRVYRFGSTQQNSALLRFKLNRAGDSCLVNSQAARGLSARRAGAREFSARYTLEPVEGLSPARNRGLAESVTDIVAYIDDDAVPRTDWLGCLLKPFEDSDVAVVTGRIVSPHASDREGVLEGPLTVNNKGAHWFEIATFGGLGRGSNMALRRSACAGWTGFDVRLGGPIEIAEENCAFRRCSHEGYTGVFLPSAVVTHPPLRHDIQHHRARNSLAYWLLLYSSFPAGRGDLRKFLLRRLKRQPLGWHRDTQDPGQIISGSWWVKVKSGLSGVLLFLRAKG